MCKIIIPLISARAPGRWHRPGGPARRNKHTVFLSLSAAAAAALGVAIATPAMATTGPSIAETSTGANIAVQGPNHSLLFYWATNGTTWHAEQVAPPGSVT